MIAHKSYVENMITKAKSSSKLLLVLGIFAFLTFYLPKYANADQIADQKEDLRNQLSQVEAEIADLENNIATTKKTQRTLEGDLSILTNEINKIYLEQKAIDLTIKELAEEITYKNKEIGDLSIELDQKRGLLEEAIKELDEFDRISWLELLLKGGNMSDFFSQVQNIYNIQKKVNIFIQSIDQIKGSLETEKTAYEDQKKENEQLKSLRSIQQSSLERKKTEKNTLLAKTKGDQKKYSAALSVSQKEIQTIKQQLYKLESVGVAMSFEEAYGYAKFVGEKTGVRPAFILGIFQVESRMGTYVGGGNWYKDMYQCYIKLGKRSRAEAEKNAFFAITDSLGLDPDAMPVSKEPYYGCGGAMGAGQFLPTTWLGYKNQVASLTGHNPPSPWNVEDAFTATSIKLAGNGANSQTAAGERKAAGMYIAGARWQSSVARNYSNQVLEWADFYQDQINKIESGPVALNK